MLLPSPKLNEIRVVVRLNTLLELIIENLILIYAMAGLITTIEDLQERKQAARELTNLVGTNFI